MKDIVGITFLCWFLFALVYLAFLQEKPKEYQPEQESWIRCPYCDSTLDTTDDTVEAIKHLEHHDDNGDILLQVFEPTPTPAKFYAVIDTGFINSLVDTNVWIKPQIFMDTFWNSFPEMIQVFIIDEKTGEWKEVILE